MKPLTRLVPASELDPDAFAAAVRSSRRLHRPWVHPPADRAAVRRLLAVRNGPADLGFGIVECIADELVGYAELTAIVRGAFRSAYLGYYAFAGFERRGLMHDGLARLLRRAFGPLGLHRVEANIQPGNQASIALVRGLGFRLEGYSPRYLKLGGRWCDHERWALLADG